MIPTRRQLLSSIAALSTVGLGHSAWSQAWPQRPVKIIVPFAPGGNTDGIARVIAQRLSETLGHQFVVENKPGANGSLAAEFVARAPADGYTLFIAALPQIAILPAMTKTPYDPVKDFAPISNVGTNPFVLVVHPSFPAKTLKEFVEHVRAQPNKISYASGGVGSLSHLSMALFLKRAGLEMTHVPYRGGAPAIADVLAGHVPMYFANVSEALPHAATGKLRFLAVSSERRAAEAPNVPTVSESGFPGFRTVTWNGLLAPAGSPADVIARLAREIALAVKEPTVAQRLASYGVDPLGDNPERFAATIAADISVWAEAVKIAGVTQ
jgi:tripartite-type tricarboxylate transporter receptor subunit TctC